jgi:23S rRNA pseudouridine1911/1915/1917 synthase
MHSTAQHTHAAGAPTLTCAAACLPACLPARFTGDALQKPHAAHRLDTATGGLLVCIKTRAAAVAMVQAFSNRSVCKRYRALLQGRLEGDGCVCAPVFGKEAETHYRAITHTRSLKFGGWITTVDMFPRTGRKHQLRQHMASLGHAILGDSVYTPAGSDVLQGQGMCLWAAELGFVHPAGGEDMAFVLPEADRFERIREQQQARWEKFYGAGGSAGPSDRSL